ncbi:winged helix-turn-helix domain-containing protein [Massilia sp. ST3]|uniref:ATP-binding protein n=1 Tax=Massilia sp. ST3 TaxID=2824903 RepID=UPI001B833FDA|nr:winged helix-turn-helix domain-containing protein [Massilia sp. ST3]MBQ5945942.1 winged helix-turn-helix domain-containing protein [Massilia sp. ST3]
MNPAPSAFTFGPFELHPVRRLLLRNGEPVQIGSRAFDVLTLLLERAGAIVGKEELMARAWPRTCVEESNLRVHISALRKVLEKDGDGVRYIDNVAGRGYSFVGPVATGGAAPARVTPLSAPARLESRLGSRLVGREDALAAVCAGLAEVRLLSVVGPGGVGKTALAVAAARQLAPHFPDGACLVELGAVTSPALVADALAAALQLPAQPPYDAILAQLRGRRLLLILDSCEHLGVAPARLAEGLCAAAPGLKILVTSREALGVAGERVHSLGPLALPAPDAPLGPDALQAYGALALFAQCAAGALDPARLGGQELSLMAEICRRLDGLPLAIELAAARVPMLGLHGVASGLGDSLALLSRSRPGGEARHQSMREVLDWSWALLAPPDQRLLRRLSVYRGAFTADCARALWQDADGAFEPAILYNLAARSLLVCDYDGADVGYRMLETTRLHAAGLLARESELSSVKQAHAARCLALMTEARVARQTLDAARWLARYGGRLADVRAALDWCFGPGGDSGLGVRLAAAATLLWSESSMLDEQRVQILRALPHARDPATELALQASLGGALVHLDRPSEQVAAAFSRAYVLAREHGDSGQRARTFSGLCLNHLLQGEYPQAIALGHAFAPYRKREQDPEAHYIHDRIMAATLHFHGDQRQARFHAERVYRLPRVPQQGPSGSAIQFDGQAAASAILARIRWLAGHSEEAAALASEAVDRAQEIDHPASICMALAVAAVPIAFWNGDARAAAYFTGVLCERSQLHGLKHWQSWAAHYRALSAGQCPSGSTGILQPGPQAETIFTILPGLAGPPDFARVGQGLAGWAAAELSRQKAVWMRTAGRPAAQAEAALLQAAAIAESQGALAWLLRVALTRAQWALGTPQTGPALAQLGAILRRFPQGFPSRDQREAQGLLDGTSWGDNPFLTDTRNRLRAGERLQATTR